MKNHTCYKWSSQTEEYEKYHVRTCKACNANKTSKQLREEFNDMMKVSVDWDCEGQGQIL